MGHMSRNDPNSTHAGPSRHGGMGPTNHSAELAQVAAVFSETYTYSVRTLRGRNLTVPRKRNSQDDLALLPVGATVIVRFDIGLPYIDGVLDIPGSLADTDGIPTTGISGYGGNTQPTQEGGYRGQGEPSDLLPGDTVIGNKDGARMGVFTGGLAMMLASGMSQMRFHRLNDLVELFSRNYTHVTDMGITKIENKDGRVNMSFRGASDQLGEAGADEENWTIRMDLGSEGDLFNFELTTPQGQTLFKLHVDSDGRCEIFGLDGVVIQSGARSGAEQATEAGGDARDTVRGNRVVQTDGDSTHTTKGEHAVTVDGNSTSVAGGDAVTSAVGDVGIAAGRNINMTATGAKDGTAAETVEVHGGDYKTTVGQATYNTPGYSLETYKGDIKLKSSLGGNINLETRTGDIRGTATKVIFDTTANDSCILGGSALVAHVAKYEQLESMMRSLLTAFDAHTHTAAGSPTTVPIVPLSTIIGNMLSAIKSLRVGVGG